MTLRFCKVTGGLLGTVVFGNFVDPRKGFLYHRVGAATKHFEFVLLDVGRLRDGGPSTRDFCGSHELYFSGVGGRQVW